MTSDSAKMNLMRIPKVHREASFSKIPDTLGYKEKVQEYCLKLPLYINKGVGLLLYGPLGTGKTALGTILLRCLPTKGYSYRGLWVDSSRLAEYKIERTLFSSNYMEPLSMMDRIRQVDLLVIDELAPSKDYGTSLIEQIIRDRVGDMKATVITTNLSPPEIKSRATGLASIISEITVPICISGHNFRQDRFKELTGDLK
jgi:DNA replication protein DnaC